MSTTTDPAHCGNCATTCAAPGATSTATCTNGVCGYACAATLTDCGHGVCVDLSKDPAHCGQCAKSCADATPRTVCAASQCVCPSSTPTYCAATNACVDTQKDAANCGACGHACQGGQCVAGQCQAVVMATITTPGAGLAVDGTSAYFSDGNGGHLYKCDVANCQATTVALANGLANATDVYYDAGTKTVFVIDAGNGTITAVTTTGAKKWTATGLTAPHGMASDGTSLFFANNGTPFTSISFVPLTTGTPVTANNINVEYPPNGGLAFSAASDSFLVVENRATGQIIQCPHKGGGGSNCSNTLGADYSLGIVTGGSYFYFTAKGSSAADSGIYYGSSFPQTQPLAVGASYATSTSPPTADATYAYWGSDAGTVWRVKVGGTPVAIATGQGALTALANDAVAVYWIGANKQLVKVAK